MIVQVTNTGSDLGKNHFDIAMPGGGVGLFNGCSAQWNASVDGWGDRYGGVHTLEVSVHMQILKTNSNSNNWNYQECDNLPEKLRPGCQWRFEWFEGADNPTVDFVEIECPQELLDISGCV